MSHGWPLTTHTCFAVSRRLSKILSASLIVHHQTYLGFKMHPSSLSPWCCWGAREPRLWPICNPWQNRLLLFPSSIMTMDFFRRMWIPYHCTMAVIVQLSCNLCCTSAPCQSRSWPLDDPISRTIWPKDFCPSTSTAGIPILLVKKKDWTLRFMYGLPSPQSGNHEKLVPSLTHSRIVGPHTISPDVYQAWPARTLNLV